jgi:hypothetical protein
MKVVPNGLIYLLEKYHIFLIPLSISPNLFLFSSFMEKIKRKIQNLILPNRPDTQDPTRQPVTINLRHLGPHISHSLLPLFCPQIPRRASRTDHHRDSHSLHASRWAPPARHLQCATFGMAQPLPCAGVVYRHQATRLATATA